MKIIIDDWEQCVCKSQGLVIIGSTYSIFGLISLLVPCRGHRRYCPLSSAWHVSHVAHVSRHRPQLHLLTLYCTLFTMYNVIYLSDKPRFLKMCVSATVSELLSVICLIWYVPPSEVLLQLWRILRCSSPREILCAGPIYLFSIDTVCWRRFGDNRIWHLSYILRWEELQITIKSTRKVGLLGEKFRFSHKLLFRPFSLVLTFPPVSLALPPQPRPSSE